LSVNAAAGVPATGTACTAVLAAATSLIARAAAAA
jgi:hypothetical protein